MSPFGPLPTYITYWGVCAQPRKFRPPGLFLFIHQVFVALGVQVVADGDQILPGQMALLVSLLQAHQLAAVDHLQLLAGVVAEDHAVDIVAGEGLGIDHAVTVDKAHMGIAVLAVIDHGKIGGGVLFRQLVGFQEGGLHQLQGVRRSACPGKPAP